MNAQLIRAAIVSAGLIALLVIVALVQPRDETSAASMAPADSASVSNLLA